MKVSTLSNNQYVINNNGEYTFQSYNSTIATIRTDGKLMLGDDWDYSQTTLKYLYKFLSMYKAYMNCNQTILINDVLLSNNKKQAMQSLIDNKSIILM